MVKRRAAAAKRSPRIDWARRDFRVGGCAEDDGAGFPDDGCGKASPSRRNCSHTFFLIRSLLGFVAAAAGLRHSRVPLIGRLPSRAPTPRNADPQLLSRRNFSQRHMLLLPREEITVLGLVNF